MDYSHHNNPNQKPTTTTTTTTNTTHHHTHKASPSDLLSSAKVVGGAAQSVFRHESIDKLDKGKVADAAADLLCAASHYGKLEGKSYGKYVEKAETYLHSYNSSHSSPPTNNNDGNPSSTAHHSQSASGGGGSGGGFGDYMKIAEGFMKKH